MTALKWITTEAKRLKKQYPKRYSTWREYVAQASAIYAKKHKGKSPIGKKRKPAAKRKAVAKRRKVANVTLRRVHKFKGKPMGDDKYIVMNDGRRHLPEKSAMTKKEAEIVAKALRLVKKARKKRIGSVKPKHRKSATPKKRTYSRRRISGKSSPMKALLPAALLIGGGLLAYKFLSPSVPTAPAGQQPASGLWQPTGNNTADALATKILTYAQVLGYTTTAISNLINSLKGSSVSQLQQYSDNIDTGQPLPASLWA